MRTGTFILHLIIFLVIFNYQYLYGYFNEGSLNHTQIIQGRVIDKTTHIPLVGATILINDSTKGTITNENGYFEISDVPVGRNSIYISFLGYKPCLLQNIMVKTGKQTVLNIELEENIAEIDQVTVQAYRGKDNAINDMAMISARSFTIEETERFAGSWGDPSRMATSYAGVFIANDQSNDIIIRGNSPAGLIWRLEGIPIPSPNHWHGLGATGGPVSLLNNNLLQRSDFLTGAFPAEYGNGISGAFDLRMRNGNSKKREYVGQLGFNGFEFGLEGPFNKNNNASYLVNYRYSMLGLVDQLLWVDALPHYQDLMFKLSFPNKKGNTSVFGLGGISKITFNDSIHVSDNIIRWIGEPNGSKTGIVGINNTFFVNNNTRIKTSLALTTTVPYGSTDSLSEEGGKVLKTLFEFEEQQNDYILQSTLIHKFNTKNKFQAGITAHYYSVNYYYKDYSYDRDNDSSKQYEPYRIKENNLILIQSFVEWKHHFSDKVTIVQGLHYEHFLYNNLFTLEPRFGAQWRYASNRSLSFGYGLHSKLPPIYMFVRKTFVNRDTQGNSESYQTNKNLDFIKSHHFVIGHDYSIAPQLRLKTEAYYQYIYSVPVKREPDYFWLLNGGEAFNSWCEEDSLVNKGTGENYGIELTLEKFLSENYYFLLTSSLFNSTYKASDDKKRNSQFNGHFVINALGGYEWRLNENKSLNFNIRTVYAGGRRYIPFKEAVNSEEIYERDYDNAYSKQLPNYFRLDVRLGYIIYKKKATYEFALDITNVTNHQNLYYRYYNEYSNTIEDEYQQGIFPMGLIRVNF